MKIITKLFQTVFLRGTLVAWNFIRRNPKLSLLILLLAVFVALLANSVALFKRIIEKVKQLFSWIHDPQVGPTVKALRHALIVLVWILLPGSFFIWALLKLMVWLFDWKADVDYYRQAKQESALG